MADIIDVLNVINWRITGCPEDRVPTPLPRPGDASRREARIKKSHEIKNKIESTEWEVA
jgi:hypothetical protein